MEKSHMRNKAVFLLAVVVIAGCVTSEPIVFKTFGDEVRSDDEIGVVKGIDVKGKFLDNTRISFPSYARIVDGKAGASIQLGNGVFGRWPNDVRMLPGDYVLQIYCDDGNKYQYLKRMIEVRAGYTTTIKCEWQSGGVWIKEGTYEVILETFETSSEET